MTLQNEKRLITFDKIRIKCNCKYLHNTKARFNEMFNPRSGEKTGIFYSSKGDKKRTLQSLYSYKLPNTNFDNRIF